MAELRGGRSRVLLRLNIAEPLAERICIKVFQWGQTRFLKAIPGLLGCCLGLCMERWLWANTGLPVGFLQLEMKTSIP